ncbi:unnamed protein product, partial [Tetraodon nigroviridis]
GHQLARRLSRMGALVFAGVLDADGAGAQELREGTSGAGARSAAGRDRRPADRGRPPVRRRPGGRGRALGFGQQRRNPPAPRRRRAAANQRRQALHGRELPGRREGVSGVPAPAEEVQRTHRQRVQPGGRGSGSTPLRLRRLQGGAGRLLKGDAVRVVGLGGPSVPDPTFRLQNEYVERLLVSLAGVVSRCC